MIRLVPERGEHASAVERLLDDAFGEARWQKTCQRLRDGQRPLSHLSLVALDGKKLVGTVRLWRVLAGGRRAVLLGPLAVEADCRGKGIGTALMNEALRLAAAAGEELVLLVGDAPYYRRFGFRPEATRGLRLPGPVERDRFLALELKPRALKKLRGAVLPLAA